MEGTTTQQTRKAGLEASTVTGAFARTVQAHGDRVALRTENGEQEITWAEYGERVDRFALGLRDFGLERGQTLALMFTNRPEFHIADSAAISLGAVPFSLYESLPPAQIAYQLQDAGARAVVTEPAFLERVLEATAQVPEALPVILVGADRREEGITPFEDLLTEREDTAALDRARAAVRPNDLVTLVYTSGTTGPPKGVEITHANFMSAVEACDAVFDLPESASAISFLPMAHVAGRIVGHYLPVVLGHTVTCCPDPRQVIGYLPEAKPTWFFAVPRVWEKLKAGIEAMVESEQDDARKQAIKWALDTGHAKSRLEQTGEQVPSELAEEYRRADELVLAKLRARLGLDEVAFVITGAAPTPFAVLEFMQAIGLPLHEVWGLSESCGIGAVSRPGELKLGTVGRCSPGMELELASDGEVLLRGPTVMKGYRNLPDETAEALDSAGWLHTGDIGELDDEGFLRIVDRKKELIITAAAKNISPANLEARLKAHPLIGTACAIGDARRYITALIVLDPDVAPAWAQQQGLGDLSIDELAQREELRDEIQRAVDEVNEQVSRAEGIKKFTILGKDWLPGGDELTPTMKLKRKPILEKYAPEIDAMYAE